MIIVKLMGGLGNQMFQYAAARRLACLYDTEVKVDLSFLRHTPEGDTKREFQLHHFSLKVEEASPLEVAEMADRPANRLQAAYIRLRRATALQRFAPNPAVEPHFHFWQGLLAAGDNVYLDGFWQSPRYFDDIADTLRKEFRIVSPLTDPDRHISRQITKEESVAIHIRRGDYVSSPKTAVCHNTLDMPYYLKATEIIRQQVKNAKFYLFSDDPEWVRSSFSLNISAEVVGHNPPDKGFEDLRLMSLCRHAIIANSSFSWWGGWLIENPEKIVLAPRRWFNDPTIDTADLVPMSWKRI